MKPPVGGIVGPEVKQAAGLQDSGDFGKKSERVSHMLEDVQTQDLFERFRLEREAMVEIPYDVRRRGTIEV